MALVDTMAIDREEVKKQKEEEKTAKSDAKKHMCMSSPSTWIASVVLEGGFRLFKGGNWDNSNVTREYAMEYADSKHLTKGERYCVRECKNYVHAYYSDIVPGLGKVFKDADGDWGINTYCPPTLELKKIGHHDSINRIMTKITGGIPGGLEYLEDWCAAKIQNPGVRSNSAILFDGKSGTGKSSLVRAIMEILGVKNCSKIDVKDLNNQAGNNGAFIDRLFTNINEVNLRDDLMSDIIKNMIDGETVKLRDKYIRTGKNGITNRNSFIFTTNIPQSIKLDAFDRRFTVFNDGIKEKVESDYTQFIETLWNPLTQDPTPAFWAEIGHWGYYLVNKKLSESRLREVRKPFETDAKLRLVKRTQSTSKDFFDVEIEFGIDGILNEYFEYTKMRSFNYVRPLTDQFIFPERGQPDLNRSSTFSESIIFEAYKFYTNKYSPSKNLINKNAFLESAVEHGWQMGGKANNGAVRVIRGVKRSADVLKDYPIEPKEGDVVAIDAQLNKKGLGNK
jgi:adenylate kinase family enzyme